MFLQLVLSGLAAGSVYAIVGLALVVIYKATTVMNFAQGEMAMFSTFLAYVFIVDVGMPYLVGVGFALAIAAMFAACVERLVIRRVADTSLLTVAVLTMGMFYMLNFVALRVFPWGSVPRRFPTLLPQSTFEVFGSVVAWQNVGTLAVALTLMGGLACFYRFTRFGIAMRAAADNPEGAALMGIERGHVSSASWMLAAVLGGIAGVLLAPLLFLDTLFMRYTLIKSLAAAVVGGFTSLPGVVVGGLFVGVAETLFGGYVSTDFKNAFVFALIIVVLLLRPQGLLTRTRRAKV